MRQDREKAGPAPFKAGDIVNQGLMPARVTRIYWCDWWGWTCVLDFGKNEDHAVPAEDLLPGLATTVRGEA